MLEVGTLPHDMKWSEAPFLLNQLKLQAGEALYGPATDFNSYSYSPGLELLHFAALAPLGLAASLQAHRVLVLGWHLLSIAILYWALQPHLARFATRRFRRGLLLLLVAGAVWSSLLAPLLHPDHALMVCFAGAIALVIAEERMPRWLFLGLFLLIPPLATCLKLTGPGVGVGLVLVFALRRRFPELLVLCVSGVVALATIPLFDATLGPFSTYAITLQASHPIRWGAWDMMFSEAAGQVALAVLGVALWTSVASRRRAPAPKPELLSRELLSVLTITLATMAPSAVAYLKVGGRANSLMPLSLGAVVMWVLTLERAPLRRAQQRLWGAAFSLWMVLTLIPPGALARGVTRQQLVARFDHEVRIVRAEISAGRRTLVYGNTAS